MEYRQLGRSGLKVSTIALGTLPFGGHQRPEFGNVPVDQARGMLDRALEAGVNLLDTADVYGYGNAERTVGEIVAGRRDKVLIASKCRAVISDDPNAGGLSRKHIILSVEHSLRRLGTDYIDIYQAHGWDGHTPIEEIISAFDQLVRDGKVRYIGCSNFSGWHIMKSLATSDRLGAQRYVSQQIYYSLLGREAEHELVPISIDQGVGILVYSPLAGGLLGGQRERGVADDELAAWREPPVPDPTRVYDIVDVVKQVAAEHEATPAQVSLAYILTKPGVTSVIVGPRTMDHLETALPAADLQLTDSDLERLDAISALPKPYPYWHQVWSASDRLSAADLTLHTPGGTR